MRTILIVSTLLLAGCVHNGSVMHEKIDDAPECQESLKREGHSLWMYMDGTWWLLQKYCK